MDQQFTRLWLCAIFTLAGFVFVTKVSSPERYQNYGTIFLSVGQARLEQTKRRRLPNAVIIGAKKAGTRALIFALSMHPQVCAAEKEVHFFDRDENYNRGTGWYAQQMPLSTVDQVTLEKTPAYFHTEKVTERMHVILNETKLIIILKDPVERIIGDGLQLKMNVSSMLKCIFPHDDNTIDWNCRILTPSLYSVHLKRWLKLYKRDQLHIVDGDRFAADPYLEMPALERFLGVRRFFNRSHFEYDERKGFHCFQVGTQPKKQCLADDKGRRHPQISWRRRRALKESLRGYNSELYTLIGRQFSW